MPQLVLSIEGVEIRRVNLNHKRTTLGRKPHNDIVLADLVVSGEHCAFNLEGLADVYVEDLHSTNGTYLNGQMVRGRSCAITTSSPSGASTSSTSVLPRRAISARPPRCRLAARAPTGRPAIHASLRVLSGSSTGLEMPVVKAVTTFGKPGIAIVAISHRRNGYYVAVMEGGDGPLLNARADWRGSGPAR
jgi:hypothetical protein